MDSWLNPRVISNGRIAMRIAIVSLLIPISIGFIYGFMAESKLISRDDLEKRLSNLSPFEALCSLSFTVSLAFSLSAAAEINGRTKNDRLSIKEINRKFTSREINDAVNLYYDKPESLCWFHTLMMPQPVVRFYLQQGWTGIQRDCISLESSLQKESLSEE